jgi:4-hydroxy-tetrahydrodipicolinate synthase
MIDFGNVITAMVTPFDKQGDVDYKKAIELANYLIDHGTDTILLAGTTGESPTLTHEEEYQLFKKIKYEIGTKALIMAGTGSNCTKTAMNATRKAEECGIDAVLQVVPYYNKPSQEGLYQHFSTIATHTKLPIMLYNIPGRSSAKLEVETIQRLAGVKNIVSIKEASGSVDIIKQLRAALPEKFKIYSGDDALTLSFLEAGAVGVVSVASHCVGIQLQEMVSFYHQEEYIEAEKINKKLKPLFDVLFITSNPVPVKAALRLMGMDVGSVRLPLVEANELEVTQINDVLARLKLL